VKAAGNGICVPFVRYSFHFQMRRTEATRKYGCAALSAWGAGCLGNEFCFRTKTGRRQAIQVREKSHSIEKSSLTACSSTSQQTSGRRIRVEVRKESPMEDNKFEIIVIGAGRYHRSLFINEATNTRHRPLWNRSSTALSRCPSPCASRNSRER
jgi:hypothetical protein